MRTENVLSVSRRLLEEVALAWDPAITGSVSSTGARSGRVQNNKQTKPHRTVGPSAWALLLPDSSNPYPVCPLLTGRGFRRDLEANGCLAVHAPLEGGAETRLLRRLRGAGYRTRITSARGLGDPEVFLTQKHGIRPPHLGHQSVGRGAAVGEVQQVVPMLGDLFDGDSPVALWLLEGQVLSRSELVSLCDLSRREPRLRIVVEMGGSRSLRWQPMRDLLQS